MSRTSYLPSVILALLLGAAITGCSKSDRASASDPSATAKSVAASSVAAPAPSTADLLKQIDALTAEVAKLRAENAELRVTPAALLADVEAAVGAGSVAKAQAAAKRLADRFPGTQEAKTGAARVAAFLAKRDADEREAERLAALGFKALKVNSIFARGDLSLNVGAVAIAGRWTFDSYDDSWRYLESERGSKFVTAKVNVTSKAKDPDLFGIGVYVAEGATMRKVGEMEYRFARWDDFGSYLGNEADFRNDFAHTSSIPFSLAVQVEDNNLKRPLYLVSTAQGCHTRTNEQFKRPTVRYVSGTCSTLKEVLTVADFKDGQLGVVKRID